MTETHPSYLSLKLAKAKKTGQRATGEITYRVLCDPRKTLLALTIVGNEGGGYLKDRPEEKFSARQIAEWVFATYR